MSQVRPEAGTVLRETRHVYAVLRLLVLVGLVLLGLGTLPAYRFQYWTLVAIYGLTIGGHLYARRRVRRISRVEWLVFIFDIGLVSAAIVARGDGASELLMAYFGLVLMAATAEGLGNAFTNALLVSGAYALLTRWGAPPSEFLTLGTISHFAFFFVIAVFMGHLAQEARRHASDRERAQAALRDTSSELRSSTEALKVARDALSAHERLATVGMLSAGLAHEIKNPLAAIVNNLEPGAEIAEELAAKVSGDDECLHLVRELDGIMSDCRLASNQLTRLARDLTAFAREGPAASVPVRPSESIDGVLRLLRKRLADGVEVDVAIRTRREVRADPGHLLQVLTNLVSNALDAMEGVDAVSERRLAIHVEDASPTEVAFVVEDTGPGVPSALKERILDPFFTTKQPGKGTGLGLHIVSEIVRAHRGSIRFETSPAGGTRFVVAFPALPAARMEVDDDGGTEDASRRGRRGDDPPRTTPDAAKGAVHAAARI